MTIDFPGFFMRYIVGCGSNLIDTSANNRTLKSLRNQPAQEFWKGSLMKSSSASYNSLKGLLRPVLRRLKRLGSWLLFVSRVALNRLKRQFVAAVIPEQAEGRVNLHLGCGSVRHEKFINIDAYPFPHVHYVHRIDRLPQFSDESVDLIYASHCLEHFGHFNVEAVLREWHRVLKKGSILRLSVPDFDKLVKIYAENNHDPTVILYQLMGGQNNKLDFHYMVFNEVNLVRILRNAGFSTIGKWHPGTEDLTTFEDYSVFETEVSGRFYDISLNIEAMK